MENLHKYVKYYLHSKNLSEDDISDIVADVHKRIKTQPEKKLSIKRIINSAYVDKLRAYDYKKNDSFGYIPKHVVNYEEVVNQLKDILTEKEYEVAYLYYVCGYTLEEIGEYKDCDKGTISRWIDKILSKIKNIKNEAEKGKDMYDESYDDDDLETQWYKDNDVWDRVEQPKTTWKQNKSVFPQVSHNELKGAIESLGLDARTQSEIFFLYNGDVNYFGWESKFLEHKDLIEDIIGEVVRLRKVKKESVI